MKSFQAVYLGSAESMSNWKAMDDAMRRQSEKAGKEAWAKWGAANASAIVDHGSPLGKTKRISAQGIADIRNEIAAWAMECLPMPEM